MASSKIEGALNRFCKCIEVSRSEAVAEVVEGETCAPFSHCQGGEHDLVHPNIQVEFEELVCARHALLSLNVTHMGNVTDIQRKVKGERGVRSKGDSPVMSDTYAQTPFREAVPALMNERGLTLTGLAREAGVSASYLSRVLRGQEYKTP